MGIWDQAQMTVTLALAREIGRASKRLQTSALPPFKIHSLHLLSFFFFFFFFLAF